MIAHLIDVTYILAASLFILGLKALGSVKTARKGNLLAALGMFLAIVITLLDQGVVNYQHILIAVVVGTLIGAVSARLVHMTAMPQMVGLFNGFGGIASALVACSAYIAAGAEMTTFTLTTVVLGSFVGAVTFTGSLVAFGKLQGVVTGQPVTYPLQKTINLIIVVACVALGVWLVQDPSQTTAYWVILGASALLGILVVLPIGGADMPVVISLLNSYSGVAAAMTGFVLMNKVLIVAGSLVGAAGLILTQIMCRAMNRSLANVVFGTFGKIEDSGAGTKGGKDYTSIKSTTAEEAVMIMESAQKVIIVPGYGLAVARAQHAIRELATLLEAKGAEVKYAIHPVAGRMPGHMNVLLAEAEVPYEQLHEMDTINRDFGRADVALVIGANDVTNPSARNEKGSPIYGMPILNVDQAQSVMVIKRSLSPGFAGIKNPLFENQNTMMLFGDAKVMIDQLVKELEAL